MANFNKGHEGLKNAFVLTPTSLEDPVLFNSHEGLKTIETYGGVPKEELLNHVLRVRDEAWSKHTFPCIGMLAFLDFGISKLGVYPEILNRVKAGESLIDFGTFFGQDLRRLAADGAPTENLYGTDIEGLFWNLGYDLFRDAGRFKATFIEADALDTSRTTSPLLSNPKLLGKLSIIHSGHFLHLFPREDTLKLICDVFLPLLNLDGPGALIVGRNMGLKEARLVKTLVQPQSTRVSNPLESFSHNGETWKELWNEVGERTGTKWDIQINELDMDAYGKGAGFVQVSFVCKYLGRS
ncbi:hypothetical protein F5883DRAFT_437499 [Diaporthe sp. PMI_573]|nr:hypothetical protein F5883DRAFT_437499 [Diaporthaceae sp. PMI_573]